MEKNFALWRSKKSLRPQKKTLKEELTLALFINFQEIATPKTESTKKVTTKKIVR